MNKRITNIPNSDNMFKKVAKSLEISNMRKSAIEQIEVHEYTKEYKGLNLGSWVALIFFAIIGTILSALGFAFILKSEINIYIILAIGFVLFPLLYILEYNNILKYKKYSYHKIKVPIIRIVGFILISLVNIGFAFLGIYSITQNEIKVNTTAISETITKDSLNIVNDYNAEILRYQTLIQDIKDNPAITASGRVLSSSQLKQINDYDNNIVRLRNEKSDKLSYLIANKSELVQSTETNSNVWFWVKLAFAAFIEASILAFIISIANYKIGIYKEYEQLKADAYNEINSMIARGLVRDIEHARNICEQYNIEMPIDIVRYFENNKENTKRQNIIDIGIGTNGKSSFDDAIEFPFSSDIMGN